MLNDNELNDTQTGEEVLLQSSEEAQSQSFGGEVHAESQGSCNVKHPRLHAYLEKRARKKEIKRQKEAAKSKLQLFFEDVAFVSIALLIAVVLKTYIGQPIFISGNSMNDTLSDKEIIWCNKLFYTPKRFDVVIINPEKGEEKQLIKRIIAMPGETVYIDDEDRIHITPADGEEYILEDKYGCFKGEVRSKKIVYFNNPDMSVTLKENEYFCMGDNRYNSADSRIYGPFSKDEIVGHAVTRIWPFTKLGDFDKENE
ncbi:MAG: signal peptidase I [Clostridiales bacterium]|nr:signal peptidase I [Clostridiales bacterium]